MAENSQFTFGGFLDDLSDNAAKALSIWGQFDNAQDDRKNRSKELDNQAKQLQIEAAERQKQREMIAADSARAINFDENLFKIASVLAIGALAGVGGWALATVIKAVKRG